MGNAGNDLTFNVMPEMLDEMLNRDTDKAVHYACRCRPQISLCGMWREAAGRVEVIAEHQEHCPDCRAVWRAGGCGACGCSKYTLCPKECMKGAQD